MLHDRPNLIVGLTGGIGSGKTFVSSLFQEINIDIVDSDLVARDVVKPGSSALSQIEDRFGPGILNEQNLNRKKLRDIIFNSPEEKDWLEHLLHPLIRRETKRQLIASSSVYTILSSPLLLETETKDLVDRLLIVDLPETLQMQRACNRDKVTQSDIKKIMASQINRKQRIELADDIVDNSGSIENTKLQVEILHQKYLKLSSEI